MQGLKAWADQIFLMQNPGKAFVVQGDLFKCGQNEMQLLRNCESNIQNRQLSLLHACQIGARFITGKDCGHIFFWVGKTKLIFHLAVGIRQFLTQCISLFCEQISGRSFLFVLLKSYLRNQFYIFLLGSCFFLTIFLHSVAALCIITECLSPGSNINFRNQVETRQFFECRGSDSPAHSSFFKKKRA